MTIEAGRLARLQGRLRQEFDPLALSVEDDSARHAGHAGAQPGGETHFSVTLVSRKFIGLGRLARSRAVHEALRDEFDTGLHALSLKLRSPGEMDIEN